jgi:3-deoxy-alpha-D-manno-octulosonate 8-oxidase
MQLTKNVLRYYFYPDAVKDIESIVGRRRTSGGHVVYLLDSYFSEKGLVELLPVQKDDIVMPISTQNEPTTDQVDETMVNLRKINSKNPDVIVGIGGGSILDIAKATSNMYTNPGKAEDYQGWDLVQFPGIYKIGIPTLSGTGAEASRTCVLMNEQKHLKLGMNSEFTIYDELILDPVLTQTVERDQYFYTGLDAYIHCIESLGGRRRHVVADAYSREVLNLCLEVFESEDIQSLENRSKIMAASYLGGAAIANSYVGVVHPFSAGLSMVLKTHHCLANCIVMNQMEDFYPEETGKFKGMVAKNNIQIPGGVTKNLGKEDFEKLYLSTIIHEKPLANALGDDFKSILTRDVVYNLFSKM